MPSSRASSQTRDRNRNSCVSGNAGEFFTAEPPEKSCGLLQQYKLFQLPTSGGYKEAKFLVFSRDRPFQYVDTSTTAGLQPSESLRLTIVMITTSAIITEIHFRAKTCYSKSFRTFVVFQTSGQRGCQDPELCQSWIHDSMTIACIKLLEVASAQLQILQLHSLGWKEVLWSTQQRKEVRSDDLFFFGYTMQLEILSSLARIEPSEVKACSLNHWTVREFPQMTLHIPSNLP